VNTFQYRVVAVVLSLTFAIVQQSASTQAVDQPSAEKSVPRKQAVDFNRDILPILSDQCFQCHGPDAEERQADLRLDTRSGLFRNKDGIRIVATSNPQTSELLRRIATSDPDELMPPPDSQRSLTARQIELIRQWIAQGAEWQQHWSFIAPLRPDAPEVKTPSLVANPIDAFVTKRLEAEQLTLSKPADLRTLLRRVTLDLTGLPPTPDELRAFLNDKSPNAYETVVDRLLKSPRYAERMAVRWLDAARYADTSGYQSDGPRDMWRWRDWVIEAFHNNKPFDEFTIEQLAGDLLPEATLDQIIATGFNRNHRGNAEGGIVPEEFQVEYVVDRVDTTFTVWQGLTMGCGRCHSHKYDPITQHEYYQVFAYFNNIPESGRALKEGNSPPLIAAPTREQKHRLDDLTQRFEMAEREFKTLQNELDDRLNTWRVESLNKVTHEKPTTIPFLEEGLAAHFLLDTPAPLPETTTTQESETALDDSKPLGLTRYEDVAVSDGILNRAARFSGNGWLDGGNVAKFGYFDSFSLGAWIRIEKHSDGTIISKMEHVDRGAGYNLHMTDQGTVQLNLVKRWLDDSLRVETTQSLPTGKWVHVLATYDGSRVADGITIYFNGIAIDKQANLDAINQTFASDDPVRIGSGNSPFYGEIDDVRIYSRSLDTLEVSLLAESSTVKELQDKYRNSPGSLSDRELQKLKYHFVSTAPVVSDVWNKYRTTRIARSEFVRHLPSVMVMQELPEPRKTHVLIRGAYDRPGDRVSPGVPSCLPPLPDEAAAGRLGFARWLVSPTNPLTARVTVNRFWRDLFGAGLVRTIEDFGAQGERPTHPQLLDWLAVEFVESGWDVKAILKTIVMSRTYQQSSRVSQELHDRDPDNRLLARGARFRLPAETVRDQALFAAGILTEQLGGPSVKPYQPVGLWQEIATDTVYEQSHGPDLYRRSLYTYWKRTVPAPMMTNFDSAGREMCEVRQSRTNTPLQALNLLNDVTFVEAARVLAQHVQELPTLDTDEKRLTAIFERVLSRSATATETAILLQTLAIDRKHFESNPSAAAKLLNSGEWPVSKSPAPEELAAWTLTASTILNLDEAITHE
jgi:hypothetical protein